MQEELKGTSGVMKHTRNFGFAASRYIPYPVKNKINFNKNNLAAAASQRQQDGLRSSLF